MRRMNDPAFPPPVFYDATLRDGAQALGITFSPAGKIRLAHLLDDFGVPYLEGGFAGSNERDMQFFRDAAPKAAQSDQQNGFHHHAPPIRPSVSPAAGYCGLFF